MTQPEGYIKSLYSIMCVNWTKASMALNKPLEHGLISWNVHYYKGDLVTQLHTFDYHFEKFGGIYYVSCLCWWYYI